MRDTYEKIFKIMETEFDFLKTKKKAMNKTCILFKIGYQTFNAIILMSFSSVKSNLKRLYSYAFFSVCFLLLIAYQPSWVFNDKAIFLEVKQWYYLINSPKDKDVHTFPKWTLLHDGKSNLFTEMLQYSSIATTTWGFLLLHKVSTLNRPPPFQIWNMRWLFSKNVIWRLALWVYSSNSPVADKMWQKINF